MKATKNDRDLKLSAKTTAKKYFADLRDEMLFGDELIEYIRASVLWEKDSGFHNSKYYQYIYDELMEMYFRIYQTCSCCYKQFFKKDMKVHNKIGYCIKCYEDIFEVKKKEIKTRDNNNITKFNALFGDKYEVITRKDIRKITQNMYLKIKCKKCGCVFLKKLSNVFRLDVNEDRELCECSKKTGKKNILADSEKGKELLMLEKREHERKRKRAQRKKKKDKLKAQILKEERLKREL